MPLLSGALAVAIALVLLFFLLHPNIALRVLGGAVLALLGYASLTLLWPGLRAHRPPQSLSRGALALAACAALVWTVSVFLIVDFRATPTESWSLEYGGIARETRSSGAAIAQAPNLYVRFNLHPSESLLDGLFGWTANGDHVSGWSYQVLTPLWPAVAGLAVPALILHRLRAARIPTSTCPACGYNLTGNLSGRCPECGQAISAG